MLGSKGAASAEHVAKIRRTLQPMWDVLPKVSSNRVNRRSLRVLAHRYFMRTSQLVVRGFEPSRSVNESHWGVADVLSQYLPAYVESVLESNHGKGLGFSISDAVQMIA